MNAIKSKEKVAVLLKEKAKDAHVPAVTPKKFNGNAQLHQQPPDGSLEIGLTKWRRP